MNIAVITGASSGIGREFALQLKQNNLADEFWLIARREDRLKELKSELNCACEILPYDLTLEQDLKKYNDFLKSKNRKIKFLINAAGYGKYGDYNTVNTEIAFNMIDLNVKALVYITQESLPYMDIDSHIIQLGSASTYNPLPNLNVYASSKAFVKHYSRALYRELIGSGVSVTTVCPGWVKTEFFSRADINDKGPDSFAKPMVTADKVVKKALRDAVRNKDVSMYHWYNNLHHFLSKILPHRFMMFMWKQMQK